MSELVSIVIPFFNGEKFFDEAIESVLQQTHTEWEVLLVDDGSQDSSTKKALALAQRSPSKFKYLSHPGRLNRGLAPSRNLGLASARGDFITYLDIDDLWLPRKLEKQLALLRQRPDVDIVYGPLHFWYGWTGVPADAQRDFVAAIYAPADCVIDPPGAVLKQVQTSNGLPGTCSFLMRIGVVHGGIRHDETFVMYEDEVFFSKIGLKHRMFFMRECLDRYRQHGDSMCAQAERAGEYVPGAPNAARRKYLEWLAKYVQTACPDDVTLSYAIEVELEVYRAGGTQQCASSS